MQILVIASHPDDEMIGMAVYLSCRRLPCSIVHITDGAPRSGEDAANSGCATWQEYADLRRRELEKALSFANISAITQCLRCPDQQAAWHIAEHARYLAELIDREGYTHVFTHPYEGGHPDHDSTAAAVHAGVSLSNGKPTLHEFASYHAGTGGFECECFLGEKVDGIVSPALTPDQRAWKRSVLDQFESQKQVLTLFPLQYEPLRVAPSYDFSRPPHAGDLHYQRYNWGVNPGQWQTLALRAFQELGISCVF